MINQLYKNKKTIIILISVILFLAFVRNGGMRKAVENFEDSGNVIDTVLNGFDMAGQKVNDVFTQISGDTVKMTKQIVTTERITAKELVTSGNMTIGGETMMKKLKTSELCIGGTCISEHHLQMLTGARDIGIKSQRNSKYLSNWDWQQDSSRKGKKDKHGHYAEHVGQFRGEKGDWEKLRLVAY